MLYCTEGNDISSTLVTEVMYSMSSNLPMNRRSLAPVTEVTCSSGSTLPIITSPVNNASLSSHKTTLNDNKETLNGNKEGILSLKTTKEAVMDAMKTQCYKVYSMQSNEGAASSTVSSLTLITKKKYDELVVALQNWQSGKKKDQFMKTAKNRFSLGITLQDNNLYKRFHVKTEEGGTTSVEESLNKVMSCESFFDIFHLTHITSLSHSVCSLQDT